MKKHFKILFLSLMILTLFAFISSCGTEIAIPDSDNGANNVEGEDAGEKGENANDDNSIEEDSGIPNCKHEYSEKVIIASTCLKEGIGKKTCSLCGKTQSVVIPKVAHVEVIDEAIAPTCTTAGKTEGKHCSVCNTILEAQKTVAALGHTEVIDEAIPATCTTPGWTEGIHCSVCNTVLVAQEAVTTSHNIVKRTHTPVSCKSNGSIELYCTSCNTVTKYETILKGHFSSTHEYASITHPEIGDLCVGFNHGDKCELCNARFIAPGTYTIMAKIFNDCEWSGSESFSFDYYGANGKRYSANSFKIMSEDDAYYNFIYFDEEKISNVGSFVITITEPYLAEVSDSFFTEVFSKYFEKGKYALSGKYEWNDNLTLYENIEQEINFTYCLVGLTEKKSGSKITVIERVEAAIIFKSLINYDTYPQEAIYFISDPQTEWCYNVERWLAFGDTPQIVSKEFFDYFTSAAEKCIA